jgi:hypothetical protein
MNTNLLSAVHLLSIGGSVRAKPKPTAKAKARSSAARHDLAKSNRRHAERAPNFDFSHLQPAPELIDDEPHMTRAEVDKSWDQSFKQIKTGRPAASTKPVWDARIASVTGRGTR